MKDYLGKWFTLPAFPGDEEQQRQAQAVHGLLLAVMTFTAVIVPLQFLLKRDERMLWPNLAVFFIALILGLIVRNGRVAVAAFGSVLMCYAWSVVTIVNLGTVRTPATAMLLAICVFVGIMSGLRSILISILASSLIVFSLIYCEIAGLLPQANFQTTFIQGITYSFLFSATGWMSYILSRGTRDALARANKEIHDRQQVELELRKLTRAVEQSPSALMITDLKGKIEYVNPQFTSITGYTPEDVVGKSPSLLRTSLTPLVTHTELKDAMRTGKVWRGEFVNRRKDGTYYDEASIIAPVTDLNGRVTHYLAVKEDITESKRNRQQIIWQRDLAQGLSTAASLEAALRLCLEHLLAATGLDCGLTYLRDWGSGDLILTGARNLSKDFQQEHGVILAGSPESRLIAQASPIYLHTQDEQQRTWAGAEEGLRALGIIPLGHATDIIACLLLASRQLDEIPAFQRALIEEAAVQVRSTLARIQAQEDLQRSHADLTYSEARFRGLFEQTHDAVGILDLTGRFLAVNRRMIDLLGYAEDELLGLTVFAVSGEPEQTAQKLKSVLAGEIIPLYERILRRKDGELFACEVNIELVRGKNGAPLHIQTAFRDISERKRADALLKASEKRYRLISENVGDVIWVLDLETQRFTYVSPSVEKLRGVTIEEALAEKLLDSMSPESFNHLQEVLPARLASFLADPAHPKVYVDEVEQYHKSGYLVPIEVSSRFVLAENGKIEVVGVSRNITRRKQVEEALLGVNELLNQRVQEVEQLQAKLVEQSLRDPLTGLHNRRYLQETLPREISRAKREQRPLSILVADLDDFKRINDTYGHQIGDEFLVAVAGLMRQNARNSDVICRYGGEEFILILPGAALDAAAKRAEEIRARCGALVLMHEGHSLTATMSLGIAAYPMHGLDSEQVIIKADRAMYLSKEAGKNRVTVWKE